MESLGSNVVTDDETVAVLKRAGFDDKSIERALDVKRRYRGGAFDELTKEAKRLYFARWLYEHQRIKP